MIVPDAWPSDLEIKGILYCFLWTYVHDQYCISYQVLGEHGPIKREQRKPMTHCPTDRQGAIISKDSTEGLESMYFNISFQFRFCLSDKLVQTINMYLLVSVKGLSHDLSTNPTFSLQFTFSSATSPFSFFCEFFRVDQGRLTFE